MVLNNSYTMRLFSLTLLVALINIDPLESLSNTKSIWVQTNAKNHQTECNRRRLLRSTAAIGVASLFPNFSPSDIAIASESSVSSFQKLPNASLNIPRVGYSFYKTDAAQVVQCTNLALNAGVRHFDVGTLYNSNEVVGGVLNDFILGGVPEIDEKGFNFKDNFDTTKRKKFDRSRAGQRSRRKELFLSHKIANWEQSVDGSTVKQHVKEEMSKLRVSYLDMVSIHSPLTDRDRRLGTYQALVDLKDEGIIRCLGVCNYGVGPLDEIVTSGLAPPAVIQLQLSPFNQHKKISQWANKYGSVLSCAAWSKLSSVDGPQDGWAVLAGIAKDKGMTKAQVLVQWAMQHGHISVPRSGAGSKVERKAIFENSFLGVNKFFLTKEEMEILDGLDEQLKPGRLGVRDGWREEDITGPTWDPTSIV